MAYTRQQLENMSIEELRRIDRETDRKKPIRPTSLRGSRNDAYIVITEVSPKGLPEFIELYNAGTTTVPLNNWVILDVNDQDNKFINFELCPNGDSTAWTGNCSGCNLSPGQTLVIWEDGPSTPDGDAGVIPDWHTVNNSTDCYITPNGPNGRGFNNPGEPANLSCNETPADCSHMDKNYGHVALFTCDPTGLPTHNNGNYQWNENTEDAGNCEYIDSIRWDLDDYEWNSGVSLHKVNPTSNTSGGTFPVNDQWVMDVRSPSDLYGNGGGIIDPAESVYISEIKTQAGTDNDISWTGDFIQLYNASNTSVDVNGWILTDNNSSYTIQNQIIPSYGFLTITFISGGSNYNYPNTNFSLGQNDSVSVYNANGDVIDSHSWQGGHLCTDNTHSYNRTCIGEDPIGNWGECLLNSMDQYNRCEEVEVNQLPGDVNMDGSVDVSDIMMVINHILYGTQLTEAQQLLADMDQNGQINIADIVLIVQQILGITPQQQSAIMNEVRRMLRPGTQQTPIRPGDSVRDIDPG